MYFQNGLSRVLLQSAIDFYCTPRLLDCSRSRHLPLHCHGCTFGTYTIRIQQTDADIISTHVSAYAIWMEVLRRVCCSRRGLTLRRARRFYIFPYSGRGGGAGVRPDRKRNVAPAREGRLYA